MLWARACRLAASSSSSARPESSSGEHPSAASAAPAASGATWAAPRRTAAASCVEVCPRGSCSCALLLNCVTLKGTRSHGMPKFRWSMYPKDVSSNVCHAGRAKTNALWNEKAKLKPNGVGSLCEPVVWLEEKPCRTRKGVTSGRWRCTFWYGWTFSWSFAKFWFWKRGAEVMPGPPAAPSDRKAPGRTWSQVGTSLAPDIVLPTPVAHSDFDQFLRLAHRARGIGTPRFISGLIQMMARRKMRRTPWRCGHLRSLQVCLLGAGGVLLYRCFARRLLKQTCDPIPPGQHQRLGRNSALISLGL